jgi:DNA repair protein RecO (recombination protein O)
MVKFTKGIVLQRYKYLETKLIAKIYTEKFGLVTCIFFRTNSKKGQMQSALLQPLYILDLSIYYNETSHFQKVKDISIGYSFSSFSPDIYKITISIFLAEFILKTIKENECDKAMFEFLVASVKLFNEMEEGINNFHLIFLFKFTKYLGIMPLESFSESNKIFDLKAGKFIIGNPDHRHFLNIHLSLIFSNFYKIEFNESRYLSISNNDRKYLLYSFLEYYNIHLDRPGELKTLKVLDDVFS